MLVEAVGIPGNTSEIYDLLINCSYYTPLDLLGADELRRSSEVHCQHPTAVSANHHLSFGHP